MADFQKTSQQQSLLWFKMNSSQINDTKGGEASVQAGAGELARYRELHGKLVTRSQMGSDKVQ